MPRDFLLLFILVAGLAVIAARIPGPLEPNDDAIAIVGTTVLTMDDDAVDGRGRFVSAFHDAGGRLLAGSDAPLPTLVPGFALHEELRALRDAGIPTP